MNRIGKAVTTAALTAGLAMGGVAVADTASAGPLNGTDANWLRSNEQTNLAEITLANIELKRATGPAAIYIAKMTKADHLKAKSLNMALSRKIGVTPPTMPNAEQKQVAAHLMTAQRVNQQYFVAQVAGHKKSIASTTYEINHGIRPRVIAYAKLYLPIAKMHLAMAQKALADWNRAH